MIQVDRISHLVFETPDLERQLNHFTGILGLTVLHRAGREVVLACRRNGQAMVLEAGSAARCSRIVFRVTPEMLERAGGELERIGIRSDARSDPGPLASKSLVFCDPNGIVVELLTEGAPLPDQPAQPRAILPTKLGHAAFTVSDPQKAAEFYTRILGFRVSDWMGDFFVFLRCNPDHHTVNFLRGGQTKLHHLAFEVADWDAIKRACDHLGRHRIALLWGPGRHPVGHNVFTYHHDPDGCIVELFTELDQMSNEELGCFDPRPWHEDNPQRPKVWDPGPFASNLWGIPTPSVIRG